MAMSDAEMVEYLEDLLRDAGDEIFRLKRENEIIRDLLIPYLWYGSRGFRIGLGEPRPKEDDAITSAVEAVIAKDAEEAEEAGGP